MHKNFTDLNPKWAAARHERAVKVANRYLEIVGDQLKKAHFEEYREVFAEEIQNGKRLSLKELHALNAVLK